MIKKNHAQLFFKPTKKNFLPVAEKIQKQIMQFKTNYRNLNEAKHNAVILKKILNNLEK